MKVAVIGIGQMLRGDDGAGPAALRAWQQRCPATASSPEIEAIVSELPGLALLDMIEGADAAILIDAVQSWALPGTIHRLSPQDLAAFGSESGSAHGWGVAETLALNSQLRPSHSPVTIRLIGIEASRMSLGNGLSQAVQGSMELAAQAIEEEVQALLATERTARP